MKLRNKKTGEIQNPNSIVITDDSEKDGVFVFRSIEQLVEEYEDYKPKEPLIDNEKIREIVRAWAEINAVRQVAYVEDLNGESCCLAGMEDGRGYCIKFVGWIPTLKDCGEYFIDELCGEGEE